MNLIAVARSSGNEVTLTASIQLADDMVAYASKERQETFHLYAQTKEGGRSSRVYAKSDEGSDYAKVDFSEYAYRFKLFTAFRRAISPAIYMFISALVTLAIIEAFGSADSAIARLAILGVNASTFGLVARIQAFQTNTLFEYGKIAAWLFSSALMLHVSFPYFLESIGFDIFDVLLKGAVIWFSAAALLTVYPYAVNPNVHQRDYESFKILVVFFALWLIWSFALYQYPLPISEQLFDLS